MTPKNLVKSTKFEEKKLITKIKFYHEILNILMVIKLVGPHINKFNFIEAVKVFE